MKKLISLFLVALILCFSFGAVSAASYKLDYENDWILGPDAEYLTNSGNTYYPVSTMDSYNDFKEFYGLYYCELIFADEETAQMYKGSSASVSSYVNIIYALVELCYEGESYYQSTEVLYIREDYLDKYEQLCAGEADQYVVSNSYRSLNFRFTKEQMDAWRKGEKNIISATSIYKYYNVPLMSSDSENGVKVVCGTVLWDKATDDFYLLRNTDYDGSKVYTVGDTLTVYKLEDEDVRTRLVEYISYVPEDDLEWMNPGELDYTTLYILAGIFFGFIPFALLAFSAVMFFVTKHKSYRRGYVLMGVGSILILLAFLLMLLILL